MSRFSDLATSAGASWFSIYLTEHLTKQYFPDSEMPEEMSWLLLHLTQQSGAGHMRTDLHELAGEMAEWYASSDTETLEVKTVPDFGIPAAVAERLEELLESGLAAGLITGLLKDGSSADELPVPRTPLLLSCDKRYLYFLKRRRAEDHFLSSLSARTSEASTEVFPLPSSLTGQLGLPGLTEYENTPDGELMYRLSAGRRFLILSGGPGTGKTTTVARLLVLIEQGCREKGIPTARVALAAPTGRAAARLGEALNNNADVGEKLTGRTLHSLLGIAPHRTPRHNHEDPLPADLVIIDEASMVDLPMMNRLLDALAPSTALLLVGDPDQLPSVEAGALLGDLLSGAANAGVANIGEEGILAGSITSLNKVYRSTTAILDTAAAVKAGDADSLLMSFRDDGVRLHHPTTPDEIAAILAEKYREAFELSGKALEPGELLFKAFASLGVLTPLRRGGWGVSAMNDRISIILGGKTTPFTGMPVMVTGNDSYRNLWNGDRGVILQQGERLRAFFPEVGGWQGYPLAALPGWEPAWVQTIHKSQGSEFDYVTILLPLGAEKLLTREILYTALTRARHRVDLYAENEALAAALSRKVVRNSRISAWAATCSAAGEGIS